MANKTANYGLTKPLPEEFYDVQVQNNNMDIIDAELKKKFDASNLPTAEEMGASEKNHASQHGASGSDPITPAMIGAAPDGYGLGGAPTIVFDPDDISDTGFYSVYNANKMPTSHWWSGFHIDFRDEGYAYQYFYNLQWGNVITRIRMNGTWSEWEYVNPRMLPDEEYRTTERVEDKAVYKKKDSSGKIMYRLDGSDTWIEGVPGAAPAGYGLGGSKSITWDEIDSTYAPGWYHISGTNTICGHTANYWYLFVSAWGSGSQHATHILYSISAATKIFLRTRNSGEWGDWKNSSPSAFVSVDEIGNYDKVLCAVYGETTLAEISEAIQAGKFVYCDFSGMFAPCMGGIGGLFFTFCCGNDKDGYSFRIDTSGWSYTTYGGFTPKAHADSHKTGGKDALTPADIGALTTGGTAYKAARLNSDVLTTATGSKEITVEASGYVSQSTFAVPTVTGYTPIGILRMSSNSSYLFFYHQYIASGKVGFSVRNTNSKEVTANITAEVLYMKTT